MDTFARQYEIAAAAAPAQQYIDPLRIKEGEIVQQRDLVGSVIAGRYKVLDLIAEGGMGAIYRVEHLSLGKALAMKVLGPEYMYNATARERFAVEAKSASCLQHANLVAVHDFSASENSLPYLVMDFVDGENLSTLIERERHLPWRKVVEFAIQICDGLNYAHNFGVVHRDLKPTNVIVTDTASGASLVKIVDFGIAKIISPQGPSQEVTRSGEVFGSPLYMSPEQVCARTVDGRTDIYALGCLMYESVTGKPPFLGDNAIATMYKHLHEKPLPLKGATRDPIPFDFAAIVFKALEKDPLDRYQSMKSMKADLELLTADRRLRLRSTLMANFSAKRLPSYLTVFVISFSLGATITALLFRLQPPAGGAAAAANSKLPALVGRTAPRDTVERGTLLPRRSRHPGDGTRHRRAT